MLLRVADALLGISGKLFRAAGFPLFKAYLQDEGRSYWDISHRYAKRLQAAARFMRQLPGGVPRPTRERQMRGPSAPLPFRAALDAWLAARKQAGADQHVWGSALQPAQGRDTLAWRMVRRQRQWQQQQRGK